MDVYHFSWSHSQQQSLQMIRFQFFLHWTPGIIGILELLFIFSVKHFFEIFSCSIRGCTYRNKRNNTESSLHKYFAHSVSNRIKTKHAHYREYSTLPGLLSDIAVQIFPLLYVLNPAVLLNKNYALCIYLWKLLHLSSLKFEHSVSRVTSSNYSYCLEGVHLAITIRG